MDRPVLLDIEIPNAHPWIEKIQTHFQGIYDFAQRNLALAQQHQKHYYDRSASDMEFDVGDYVLLEAPPGGDRSLAPRRTGPFQISSKRSNLLYVLRDGDNHIKGPIHIRRLERVELPSGSGLASFTPEDAPSLNDTRDIGYQLPFADLIPSDESYVPTEVDQPPPLPPEPKPSDRVIRPRRDPLKKTDMILGNLKELAQISGSLTQTQLWKSLRDILGNNAFITNGARREHFTSLLREYRSREKADIIVLLKSLIQDFPTHFAHELKSLVQTILMNDVPLLHPQDAIKERGM